MKLPKYFYFRVKASNLEIEDASNEDVVEVVRCKDCKHASNEPFRGKDCWICNKTWWRRSEGMKQDNYFCADGERREP